LSWSTERRALVALNGAASLAAVGGMVYAFGGAPDVPVEWLERSPFTSYRVPGLVLGGVYAPISLAAAWSVARERPHAADVALAAAAVQEGWIATQVRIIGYRSFLQPLMGAVGIADLALAWRLRQATRGQSG
jgi:hypothetical protein